LSEHPRVPACASKNRYDGGSGVLRKFCVIEKLAPCGKMFLSTGEVAAKMSRYYLEKI
jgi:hypothetical protein